MFSFLAGAPMINDVTTSPDHPVDFLNPSASSKTRAPAPQAFKAAQQKAYSDLKPIDISIGERAIIWILIKQAARDLNWDIVFENEATLHLEAVATTELLQFKDDVAVEVRKSQNPDRQWQIHVRSKSRLGRGDLGANAQRIRAYTHAIAALTGE